MQNFIPAGHTYVCTPHGRFSQNLNFFECIDLPNFLAHRAPLRVLRARELRYEIPAPSLVYDIFPLFKTGMKGDVEI